MVFIYLVRHGQTYFNKENLAQGWSDAPLTEEGIETLKETGVLLSRIRFKEVYTSDLYRAYSTAKIILNENLKTPKNIHVNQIKELRELNFGSFEEQSNLKLAELYIKDIKFKELPSKLKEKNVVTGFINSIAAADKAGIAESYDEFSNRIVGEFKRICESFEKKGNGNMLMVSHGMLIRVLLKELNISKEFAPKNGEVFKIRFDGKNYTLEKRG